MNLLPQMFQDIQSVNHSVNELELGPYDVLCGRRKDSFNHVGNRRFRVIISLNLQRYINSPTRFDRSDMILSLVRELRDKVGVRFLKKKGSKFVELSEKECREKVGHALRDTAAQHQTQILPNLMQHNNTTKKSNSQTTKVIRKVTECSKQGEARAITPHFQLNALHPIPVHRDIVEDSVSDHILNLSQSEQDSDDSDNFSLSDESLESILSGYEEREAPLAYDQGPIPLEWM
jgi:hypothetical protein